MKILIVTPAPPHSRTGNRVTALRWARILRDLGHRVTIDTQYKSKPCDMMIALHSRRSAPAISAFAATETDKPLIVALTGTDLYGDIKTSRVAQESLRLATRLIVLQPEAMTELAGNERRKTRVIHQSVSAPARKTSPRNDRFQVCVLGHIRAVKDPLRTALAVRRLPRDSQISVVHVGRCLDERLQGRVEVEAERNVRYQWLGELPRHRALRVLAKSRLLVLSSKMEGGANVISEAIVAGVPVLASRISGSIGLLGKDYPGFYPVGDTAALTTLLRQSETDPPFYRSLLRACRKQAPLFKPSRERQTWAAILKELCRK